MMITYKNKEEEREERTPVSVRRRNIDFKSGIKDNFDFFLGYLSVFLSNKPPEISSGRISFLQQRG